jgi:hypothetical protein
MLFLRGPGLMLAAELDGHEAAHDVPFLSRSPHPRKPQ